MIGKVFLLRMIHQLVEEGLGFTTLNVRFEILDFAHTGYLCFWALGFLCLSEARLFVGLKCDGKVIGLMIHG